HRAGPGGQAEGDQAPARTLERAGRRRRRPPPSRRSVWRYWLRRPHPADGARRGRHVREAQGDPRHRLRHARLPARHGVVHRPAHQHPRRHLWRHLPAGGSVGGLRCRPLRHRLLLLAAASRLTEVEVHGQDGDADRRAGHQPVRAQRPLLRGGERHEVRGHPLGRGQRRRHRSPAARRRQDVLHRPRRTPRRRPPAPARRPGAGRPRRPHHPGPARRQGRGARPGGGVSQPGAWGAPSLNLRRFAFWLMPCFLSLSPVLAQPATPKPASEVERLSHLARLWGTARYLHPWLAYREIDWDAALVRAIPRVRAAKTPEQYAAAVQTMLDALGDAVTRVQPVRTGDPAEGLPPGDTHPSLVQWVEPGILSLYCRPDAASTYEELVAKLTATRLEILKAKAMIVDVRGIHGWPFYPQYLLSEVENLLVARPATAPAQRHLVHSGYRSQLPGRQGTVSSGFETQYPDSFPAAAGPAPGRVVFLVSPETVIPPLVAALQVSGQGAIVAEGKIGEEGLVHQRTVALGEGFEALVRTTEIVPVPGWPGLHADVEVPAKIGETDLAFQAAVKLARDGWPAPSTSGMLSTVPPPSGLPDKPYKEMTDPSLEYRLLAVFRLWNVFHYFHPYIELAGDWDAVLPEFIARMEKIPENTGGRDYALTIAEMAARTGDGHTSL